MKIWNKTASEFNLAFTGRTYTRNRAQTKTAFRKAAHKADRKAARLNVAVAAHHAVNTAWDHVRAHTDALCINSEIDFNRYYGIG